MKRLLLLTTLIFTVAVSFAQSTDTLTIYTGTYKFPEGSMVATADILLENGTLSVNSSQGSSPLERQGKDTFALTNFGGVAYFLRNAEGKVDRVRVEVGTIVLEGTKENPAKFNFQYGELAWLRKKTLQSFSLLVE